ncbi:hypothetical protein AX14_013472 [Amanita brunnescens Koide BX004]|nr:hypothetical protein AX14_013472 [Amanita brunnescens Koide BX004]
MIIIFFPISALRYSRRIPSLHLHRFISQAPDVLPVPPCLKSIDTPEDKLAARTWILEFKKLAIPKRLVGFTFARSSGPGGQNVNKVNTKASLRCGLDAPWIPAWAKPELRRSTHYVASTDEVLITSTVHRSQAQNIEECLSQLHALLMSASSSPIRNDPSEEQKGKVRGHERAEKAARRKEKSHRRDVKRGRSNRDWD